MLNSEPNVDEKLIKHYKELENDLNKNHSKFYNKFFERELTNFEKTLSKRFYILGWNDCHNEIKKLLKEKNLIGETHD